MEHVRDEVGAQRVGLRPAEHVPHAGEVAREAARERERLQEAAPADLARSGRVLCGGVAEVDRVAALPAGELERDAVEVVGVAVLDDPVF